MSEDKRGISRVYRASDGAVFDNYSAARNHNAGVKRAREREESLAMLVRILKDVKAPEHAAAMILVKFDVKLKKKA